MLSCCIRGCESYREVGTKKISYFKFPFDNKTLLREWLTQIPVTACEITEQDQICSAHFLSTDIDMKPKYPCLKPFAVPQIFPIEQTQQLNKQVHLDKCKPLIMKTQVQNKTKKKLFTVSNSKSTIINLPLTQIKQPNIQPQKVLKLIPVTQNHLRTILPKSNTQIQALYLHPITRTIPPPLKYIQYNSVPKNSSNNDSTVTTNSKSNKKAAKYNTKLLTLSGQNELLLNSDTQIKKYLHNNVEDHNRLSTLFQDENTKTESSYLKFHQFSQNRCSILQHSISMTVPNSKPASNEYIKGFIRSKKNEQFDSAKNEKRLFPRVQKDSNVNNTLRKKLHILKDKTSQEQHNVDIKENSPKSASDKLQIECSSISCDIKLKCKRVRSQDDEYETLLKDVKKIKQGMLSTKISLNDSTFKFNKNKKMISVNTTNKLFSTAEMSDTDEIIGEIDENSLEIFDITKLQSDDFNYCEEFLHPVFIDD